MTGLLLPASQGNAQSDAPANHVKAVATKIASAHTKARAVDGKYISWREHIIDDQAIGGVAIRGGDGLALVDLDLDGHLDVVSVQKSDTEYDRVADGHVRFAFGSGDPKQWELVTLGEGSEAGAAEDIAVGDMIGAACFG